MTTATRPRILTPSTPSTTFEIRSAKKPRRVYYYVSDATSTVPRVIKVASPRKPQAPRKRLPLWARVYETFRSYAVDGDSSQ